MSDKTDVGSYFISNYPPYSFWNTEQVGAARKVLEQAPVPATPLGLYLHIPFCRKRCKFCYYRVYTDKNASEVNAYLDALAREIEMYSRMPVLEGRDFRFVYFGGGTPSFLGSKQLRSLVDRLRQCISWDDAEEVTFECEPGTLHQHKVQALREIGVTRLSLGVENFEDQILAENGRAHLSPEIYRAYEWIRSADFDQVNIDLIAGMVGETWETWKENVRKAIALAPDSVTVYQMELPYNTIYSRAILQDGASSPVADWDTKRAWVDYAFDEFAKGDYRVSSAYTLIKGKGKFVYRDALWHGADLVGAGVASFSHVGGIHYQNLDSYEAYVGSIEKGELPLSRALPTTRDQQLVRELILQTKTGTIDTSYFQKKFDRDILEVFQPVYDRYEKEGLLSRGANEIRLTRKGLLQVDGLLPEFFEPQHRNARYT